MLVAVTIIYFLPDSRIKYLSELLSKEHGCDLTNECSFYILIHPFDDTFPSRYLLYVIKAAVTKYHRLGTTEIYCLTALVARSPKSRCHWQGWFLLRAMRGGSVPGLSLWLVDGQLLCVSFHTIFPLRMSL